MAEQLLIIVDTYSKYIEISKLPDMSQEPVIKVLKESFSCYGIPKILYIDFDGSQISESFVHQKGAQPPNIFIKN